MLPDANGLGDSYSQTQLALRRFKIEGLKNKSVFLSLVCIHLVQTRMHCVIR